MKFTTIKVHMTGNCYYPEVTITRDGDRFNRSNYQLHEPDVKRVQQLFDAHKGSIYVDIENSTVELMKTKP